MFDGSTMKGIREAVSSYAASFDPNQITAVNAQLVVDDAIATENMLATIKALAAKRLADTELWEREGHMSAAHQLAKKSGTSVAKAREALDTADALAKLPGLSAAARAGELSSSQAGAIADAATKNPKAEERLMRVARKGSLGELKDECARTKAAVERDPDARQRAIHRSRCLRQRRTADDAGEITYRSTLEEVAEMMSILQELVPGERQGQEGHGSSLRPAPSEAPPRRAGATYRPERLRRSLSPNAYGGLPSALPGRRLPRGAWRLPFIRFLTRHTRSTSAMKIHDKIVYGERLSDLMPGLVAFGDAAFFDEDGMVRSSVTLEPAVGEPLTRALMRAEAELLLEDADGIGSQAADWRTPDQRRADAFVRVVLATGEARASSPA